MKIIHGWRLPDTDTHFSEYFERLVVKGLTPEYQQEQRDRAISYCNSRRVAVDVGAHVGLWSRSLCESFTQVISFEPLAEFRELLTLNSPLSTVLPYALGDLESTVRMEVPPDNTGMAHIVPDSEETGDVEVRMLDSFEINNVDLIKIDCEGYEYPVLLGATETLRRCKPVVVVEQKAHQYFTEQWGQYEALNLLRYRCGYRVAERVIDDWILIPVPD